MEVINNPNTMQHHYLLDRLVSLRDNMTQQAITKLSPFARYYPDGLFSPSAINLVHYLILRQNDLRELQNELSSLGLSSLGRGESNILENIDNVIELLEQITNTEHPSADYGHYLRSLSADNESLACHTDKLLGVTEGNRQVRIMVTLPTEAATNYELVHSLINAGMNCARINCAHDDKHTWLEMIHNLHRAENQTGKPCHIMMDLAGQKIRTGVIEAGPAVHHIKVKRNTYGDVTDPGKIAIVSQQLSPATVSDKVSHIFRISLENEQYVLLKTGDILTFTDVRGKSRKLEIFRREQDDIIIGLCWQSAYITPDTVFTHKTGENSSDELVVQQDLSIQYFERSPVKIKVHSGDHILLTQSNIPGRACTYNEKNEVIKPAQISISHDEVLEMLKPGNTVWIDDGKIGAVVDKDTAEGLLLKVLHSPPKGAFIRSEKGINFPDTDLTLSPLTDKDLVDLDFIVQYADMVAYSFVQSREDMSLLLYELKKRNAPNLPIIAKIETNKAVKNLPEIILGCIGRSQLGIMIARGDLAIELGSIRMAEIQEEILWICEAAHVPVIWATQVLESLAKNGINSRPEITDAAMSVRAECVLLNKGEYIIDALTVLDSILNRMQEHQHKKTPTMRALKQWSKPSFYSWPDEIHSDQ